MDIQEKSMQLHEKLKGKIEILVKYPTENREDLALVYTPGVAGPALKINEEKNHVYALTGKGNSVAIVSDGSAVLGLGNIGAEAALPVMEGKAALLKEYANIDAIPLCLASQNIERTIETVKNIAPVFGGIILEDIKAPECFTIEEQLQDLGIPVMHDDQHGTAVIVLAGLINAATVISKDLTDLTVVINGAGAAGTAIAKLLVPKVKKVVVLDSTGALSPTREDVNLYKKELISLTGNLIDGKLAAIIKKSDVFIGVSIANILTPDMIQSMSKDPIIFAMANPDPEIQPELAFTAGAAVVATGRSDLPNQVNNILGFPGIFRGALDARATQITEAMKLAAAETIAELVAQPTAEKILPSPLDKNVVPAVAESVKNAWKM